MDVTTTGPEINDFNLAALEKQIACRFAVKECCSITPVVSFNGWRQDKQGRNAKPEDACDRDYDLPFHLLLPNGGR